MKTINLRTAALVIAGLGLLALARAVTFDTAPDDTHNIGLMQVQMLWSQFASTMLLVGAVFFIGDRIVEAGRAAADLESR